MGKEKKSLIWCSRLRPAPTFELGILFLQDQVLEYEVRKNGFGFVLRTREGKSLRNIVHEKLKHPRNKILSEINEGLCFDEMLSSL